MGSPSSASCSSTHNWAGRIAYYPEVDKNLDGIICSSDTVQNKRELMEVSNETIQLVRCYKVPLGNITGSCILFYHRFVVFKTTNWWWSIEKNDTEIIIQRSKYETAVKDRLRREQRNGGAGKKPEDTLLSKVAVSALLKMLADKNETDKKYHLLKSNCKEFGKSIFRYISDENVRNDSQ